MKSKDNSQAIFNILAQLILNGVNFILIMLFTRFMTTDNYGIVSVYQAYVLFMAVIAGLNSQGSIGPAFVHINEERHNDYLASIMLLSLIGFLIICMVSFLSMPWISSFSQLEPSLIYLMLGHSFGNFCFNFANVKYVYSRKAQYSCLMALAVSAAMVLLSWVGITQTSIDLPQYMIRILGLAIPYILCGIFVLLSTFSAGNPFISLKEHWKFCVPICIPLVFHGISQVILAQTDKIMLQKMLQDNSTVGVYSFIVTFVHVLNSIYVALNNTWIPIYYSYIKEKSNEELYARTRSYAFLFTSLVVGFLMVAPEFVKLFADSAYWGGISLIPIVALSVFMVFLYSFSINYELYYRESRWIAVGTTAAAICNIILNSLLIPYFKTYGAAVATLISYVLLYYFHEHCAKNIKGNTYPFAKLFFAQNLLIVIFFSVLFYVFQNMWVIRWILAFAIGFNLLCKVYKKKTLF